MEELTVLAAQGLLSLHDFEDAVLAYSMIPWEEPIICATRHGTFELDFALPKMTYTHYSITWIFWTKSGHLNDIHQVSMGFHDVWEYGRLNLVEWESVTRIGSFNKSKPIERNENKYEVAMYKMIHLISNCV